MFSTIDKAWIAGVVAFVCQYIVLKFFGVEVTEDLQAIIVTAIAAILTAVATWAMPNKPPKS